MESVLLTKGSVFTFLLRMRIFVLLLPDLLLLDRTLFNEYGSRYITGSFWSLFSFMYASYNVNRVNGPQTSHIQGQSGHNWLPRCIAVLIISERPYPNGWDSI